MKKLSSKQKKKRLVASATALATLALLAGTFAWVQMKDERINQMNTKAIADGSVQLDEDFTPNPNWEIGTENDKVVGVKNLGDQPVFVRVSYEEVLKAYKNKAAQTANPSGVTGKEQFPVAFNAAKYEGAEWVKVDTSKITFDKPQDAKLVVKAKGSKNANGNVSLDYVAYYEYATGEAQKVSMDLSVANVDGGSTPDTWTFNGSNVNFYTYAGQEFHSKDWAGYNTLLGTKGTKYGVTYDYNYDTLGQTPGPVAKTLATGNQIPHVDGARWVSEMQADTDLDKALYAVYDNMVENTNLTENKWAYNEEDGYFYYLNALASGESTDPFLTKLGLANHASGAYSNINYDLVVSLEAIQSVKAALTDTDQKDGKVDPNGGWNMDTSKPTTKRIVDFLSQYASKDN